jgi:hypothetical protein
MTCAPLRYVLMTRPTTLVSLLLTSALMACSLQPRPEVEAYRRSFYKIRFDSSMSVVGLRAANDSTRLVLTDVVEIGGRVLAHRADTVVIAPSYTLTLDREHLGEGRTIRRSGRLALLDSLFVPVQPGVRIEPWESSRRYLVVAPILGLLTSFLLLRFGHH